MFTYIVQCQNYFKIGRTEDVSKRWGNGNKTNNPFKCYLIAVIEKDIEADCHELLEDDRVRGEWFALSRNQVNHIINNYGFKKISDFVDIELDPTSGNIKADAVKFVESELRRLEESNKKIRQNFIKSDPSSRLIYVEKKDILYIKEQIAKLNKTSDDLLNEMKKVVANLESGFNSENRLTITENGVKKEYILLKQKEDYITEANKTSNIDFFSKLKDYFKD